jgi:hypothetical protein
MKAPIKTIAAGTKPHTAPTRLKRVTPGEATDTATEEHHVSEETKRPTNLRADILPKDGFVLTIDGKMKSRYDTAEDALAAGTKLKQRYPVIQVAVYDATAKVYTLVNAPAE